MRIILSQSVYVIIFPCTLFGWIHVCKMPIKYIIKYSKIKATVFYYKLLLTSGTIPVLFSFQPCKGLSTNRYNWNFCNFNRLQNKVHHFEIFYLLTKFWPKPPNPLHPYQTHHPPQTTRFVLSVQDDSKPVRSQFKPDAKPAQSRFKTSSKPVQFQSKTSSKPVLLYRGWSLLNEVLLF